MVKITKDPTIAGILSFLVCGLGQVYSGNVVRGLAFFFGFILGYICFIIPGIIIWVCNIFDAVNQAKKVNEEN